MKKILTSVLIFLTSFAFAFDTETQPCSDGITRIVITGSVCKDSKSFFINEIVVSYSNDWDHSLGYYGYDQLFTKDELLRSLAWFPQFKEMDSKKINELAQWINDECIRTWSHGTNNCIISF
jgi:hypothetical protein